MLLNHECSTYLHFYPLTVSLNKCFFLFALVVAPHIFLVAQQQRGPPRLPLALLNYHLSTCHWLTEALTNLRTLPQSGRASGWENKRGGILRSTKHPSVPPPVAWLKRWLVLMAAWLSDHMRGHITDNSAQRNSACLNPSLRFVLGLVFPRSDID